MKKGNQKIKILIPFFIFRESLNTQNYCLPKTRG